MFSYQCMYSAMAQIVLLRTNVGGFRDTLCDTQPVTNLSDSDEVFAVELPPTPTNSSDDRVTAVVVNCDASSSLRFAFWPYEPNCHYFLLLEQIFVSLACPVTTMMIIIVKTL